MKKSGTLSKPCLARCKETIVVPPVSEIGIVVKLKKVASERSVQKVDSVVGPSYVFPNEDGLLIFRTVTTTLNNYAAVQVSNLSTHGIQLDSETPIGAFYSCGVVK